MKGAIGAVCRHRSLAGGVSRRRYCEVQIIQAVRFRSVQQIQAGSERCGETAGHIGLPNLPSAWVFINPRYKVVKAVARCRIPSDGRLSDLACEEVRKNPTRVSLVITQLAASLAADVAAVLLRSMEGSDGQLRFAVLALFGVR